MACVVIRIYQKDGSAAQTKAKLTCTKRLETSAAKRLTAKIVRQILAKEFPEFGTKGSNVIKTEQGWRAMRAIQPTVSCSYHYLWGYAIISEES
jgi:hypothetical protein